MKIQLDSYTAWATAAFQTLGRDFDPELLLRPGGSIIAIVLWVYAKAAGIALRLGIARNVKPGKAGSVKLAAAREALLGDAVNRCHCR